MQVMVADLQGQNWDDIRVFLAAFRTRALGPAARRLGVNASTVSRRLAAFEAELGQLLFERTREGLLPTQAAARIHAAAERMEAARSQLARDASAVDLRVEGVVRLSAAPGLLQERVAPALVRLHARHPALRIELDASVRPLDLSRREADLALRSVPLVGAELVATKLGTARWVAAASPAWVKRLGRMSSWEHAPWIGWDTDMASFHVARWLARHAPRAEVVLRTSHYASQVAAARTGLGLMLLPENDLSLHPLAPVRIGTSLKTSAAAWPRDDLWLVSHRSLRELPRVAAVWSFLLEELRS